MKLKFLVNREDINSFYLANPSKHIVWTEDIYPAYAFYGLFDGEEIVAVTSYEHITDNLVQMWSTVVDKNRRGQGIGKELNIKMEKMLKKKGYGKIVSYIYTENLSSIVLKLKRGYLIEGLLRDHDYIGQHEYVLGKLL